MKIESVMALLDELSERDLAILHSLERFRLLGTGHVCRLHFTGHASELAATRACARTLRRLGDLGVVSSLERRVGGVRRGSASYVWQLAAAGERLLRAMRGDVRRRRYVEPGRTFVAHTLAVNDVAVAVLEAGNARGGFTVESLTGEPSNWRRYLGTYGDTKWLKPDLHIVTARADPDDPEEEIERHDFIEVDLGTEHMPRIQAKCRAYAAYSATGVYQAEHGLLPAVVWLNGDSARRAALEGAVAATAGLPAGVFRVCSPERYLGALRGVD